MTTQKCYFMVTDRVYVRLSLSGDICLTTQEKAGVFSINEYTKVNSYVKKHTGLDVKTVLLDEEVKKFDDE